MKKKIIIVLAIIFIILLIGLRFYNEIGWFIYEKIYDHKYKDAYYIEKDLSYDIENNLIEENLIEINDFKIILSDLNYTENELNFNLNFSHLKPLNHSGYILRVFNKDYCLGDKFNGQISLDSSFEWLISMDKFYEKNFSFVDASKNMSNRLTDVPQNDHMLFSGNIIKKDELLEDGSLVHKISIEIPKEFDINNDLQIMLFDMNYQNVGDTNFYQVKEPLTELKYNINF